MLLHNTSITNYSQHSCTHCCWCGNVMLLLLMMMLCVALRAVVVDWVCCMYLLSTGPRRSSRAESSVGRDGVGPRRLLLPLPSVLVLLRLLHATLRLHWVLLHLLLLLLLLLLAQLLLLSVCPVVVGALYMFCCNLHLSSVTQLIVHPVPSLDTVLNTIASCHCSNICPWYSTVVIYSSAVTQRIAH